MLTEFDREKRGIDEPERRRHGHEVRHPSPSICKRKCLRNHEFLYRYKAKKGEKKKSKERINKKEEED